MRKLLPLLFFCGVCFPSVGAGPSPAKLTGIINLPGYKCALLECFDPDLRRIEQFTLQEGQRVGWVEILQIDPINGVVKLKVRSSLTNEVLNLDLGSWDAGGETQPSAHPAIQLREAALDEVISLYAEFMQRTVLRPPLAKNPVTLRAEAANQAEAAAVVARSLADKGLTNILDGNKFVMIVPVERASMANPHSAQLEFPPAVPTTPKSGSSPEEIIPSGTINFPGTDLYQVLSIYAEMIGRQFDRNADFPWRGKTIFLRTQSPLTKEEAIYALDTVFRAFSI